MKKYAQIAALSVVLTSGSVLASQAADTSGQGATIRYAQMNSPGDGLDKSAASEGNGRPRKTGMRAPKKKRVMKRR